MLDLGGKSMPEQITSRHKPGALGFQPMILAVDLKTRA